MMIERTESNTRLQANTQILRRGYWNCKDKDFNLVECFWETLIL